MVGFFPNNATAGYGVFASVARKLQGMISFGACFDPILQKKFLGAPASRSTTPTPTPTPTPTQTQTQHQP